MLSWLPAPLAAAPPSLDFTLALHPPGPVLILLPRMDPGEARSWHRADVGIAYLLGGELRAPCGFLAWGTGGECRSRRSRKSPESFSQRWGLSKAFD